MYFYTHESGGVSIITVSYSSLLRNLDRVFFLIMSVSSVALLFLIFLGVWERHLQKKLSRVNETVAALGNLYYAIYRINWKRAPMSSSRSRRNLPGRFRRRDSMSSSWRLPVS